MTVCMIKIRNNYGVFMQLPLAPLEDATALQVMKATLSITIFVFSYNVHYTHKLADSILLCYISFGIYASDRLKYSYHWELGEMAQWLRSLQGT